MTVYRTIAEFRAARGRLGAVAFVPTMGALHAGTARSSTSPRPSAVTSP
jgi:pantothenate synthetase